MVATALMGKALESLGSQVILGVLSRRHRFLLWFRTAILRRQSKLRVSMAAVLRISCPQGYLLVESDSRKGIVGPIGGALKFWPGGHDSLDALGFSAELRNKDEDTNDLRGFIRAGRLMEFLRWFEKGVGRELGPLCVRREILEEVPEIRDRPELVVELARAEIRRVGLSLVGPQVEGPENQLVFRAIEIYELCAGRSAAGQIQAWLLGLTNSKRRAVIATREEIERGHLPDGTGFASHTKVVLGLDHTV